MKKSNNNLPLLLMILDGWGIDKPNRGNAIELAHVPTYKGLYKSYPSTQLYAHGKYVGLPKQQVGNSEAGHMNIGAGRLTEQDAVTISKSIDDKTFFKNSAFLGAIRHVRKKKSKMHIMGMISNGQSPHSDPKHLFAILKLLEQHNVDNVYLHLFTDGRDSPKYAGISLIDELQAKLTNNEKIASIMGRFYAMDRKKKWERTEMAFNTLVFGEARTVPDPKKAIIEAYNRGNTDEFIQPCIVYHGNGNNSLIQDGDSVIFFNLRSDRGRQLTKAFVQKNFSKKNPGAFKRRVKLESVYFVAMTDFGPDLDDILTAYPSVDVQNTLPMQMADFKQLYLAETEKYAHVTYFFNGGYAGTVAGEKQVMIDSPDVRSYDESPGMSSNSLTKYILNNIKKDNPNQKWEYDFSLLNFAAPDMVGHTGNLKAGIETCEIVDKCVKKIVDAYLSVNGTVVITADHGNIEKMINLETSEIYTAHTTNKVPLIVVNKQLKNKIKLSKTGVLGDIAPTIMKIMNKNKSKDMSGKSLIEG